MTILLKGTPAAAIWNTAELGYVLVEAVSRPSQVVYSFSERRVEKQSCGSILYLRL